MARIIGTAGEFQGEEGIRRRVKAIAAWFLFVCVLFFIFGFAAARYDVRWAIGAIVFIVPVIWLANRWSEMELRSVQKHEVGADGERKIGKLLKDLPDAYTVINDFDFVGSYGNIDHLVIGPKGVFAIDVKNWRGTVSSDGDGELLLNGQPTDKPMVRTFTRRVMELKDRLKALVELDPYVQGLFVFPHTHVEAKWGKTGSVHCIHADQIADYIAKYNGSKPIPVAEASRLVSAVNALRGLARPEVPPAQSEGQN
ncbi:MAG: nuclease-related domain-containing protein [Desulforhabdus sp.]|jgi:hypothetical protein|nr:nuclease-related domain-containing protein [Desulforhabdus sp.]